jgi:hypothetical protein
LWLQRSVSHPADEIAEHRAGEDPAPVLLALRLKVAGKQITEIETLVTRGRADGALFNPDTLMTPRPAMNVVPSPAQLLSRAEGIRIAEFYPMGLKVGGSFSAVDAPFAPEAYRLENGGLMAGPGARPGAKTFALSGSSRIPT